MQVPDASVPLVCRMRRLTFYLLWSLPLTLASATVQGQENAADRFSWYDAAKTVTAEACAECHAYEYDKWEQTKHATSFATMHRMQSAEVIARAMGFKLMKRESLCVKCHYLGVEKGGQLRATSGVSCESCHGPARDWIDLHNDYGKGADFRTESAEHKARRIAQSKANGMFRPSELYYVVANCFQCHTVPHERLVDVGGHTTGSDDFEFVQRAGRIQHNFLQAQFDANSIHNVDRSPERKRIMYVVGRTIDLEYGLRGVAAAQQNGAYRRAMEQRVRRALNNVKAINKRASIPEVREILRMVETVEISNTRGKSLLNLADGIGGASRRFIAGNDGSRLSTVDELIEASGATIAAPLQNTVDHTSAQTADAKDFKTTGAGCNCHAMQNHWLSGDAHSFSLDPFTKNQPRNVEIARRYGIEPSRLTHGSSRCMDCHATVYDGQESEDAFAGIGCESCHGPAEKYRDVHQKQGYVAGKGLGMIQLRDIEERARVCARCHHITDKKLLAAGHTTGADFDFAAADRKIVHWSSPSPAATDLARAYKQTKSTTRQSSDAE